MIVERCATLIQQVSPLTFRHQLFKLAVREARRLKRSELVELFRQQNGRTACGVLHWSNNCSFFVNIERNLSLRSITLIYLFLLSFNTYVLCTCTLNCRDAQNREKPKNQNSKNPKTKTQNYNEHSGKCDQVLNFEIFWKRKI